jgi:N-acetylmuramoyl-L-alanine amidase
MPNRKKSSQRSRTAPLLVLAVLIFAGIWTAEQLSARGLGPDWLQFLFAAARPTGGLHVGLVAGHAGNDSGADCPDGLTEVEVNLRVADLVAEGLRRQGMRVEVMDEFDSRLAGFGADAFVAIHADSCQVDYSGFKVANEEGGSDASVRLATCLWDEYEKATGLSRHSSTITLDMTRYHAFREISTSTPASIIELGFLNADRELLTEQPDRAAKGIVNGIVCFLAPSPSEAEAPAP